MAMHSVKFSGLCKALAGGFGVSLKRNVGAASALKSDSLSDPIQKLYLDKLQEHKAKSKQAGSGKLVDSNADTDTYVKGEVENLKRRYGGGDLEAFPKFSFQK